MSQYSDGARTEREIRRDLEFYGYDVARSAGSKGAADLIAIGTGEVLLCQVKRSKGPLPPAERQRLVALAERISLVGALPIHVERIKREPIRYWLLTGTGPDDRIPYEPESGERPYSAREAAL